MKNRMNNYLEKELYSLVRSEKDIFDFIQVSALDGLWYWDLKNPANEWMNDSFWHTLGYDPEKMPHKAAAWQDIIHPDDLETAKTNFLKHCEDAQYPYDQVVRYRHNNGSTVWIRCRGIAIRDENGQPVRMLGAHTDITQQKNYEIALEERIDCFHHIIEGTELGTWQWNLTTNQIEVNEQWTEILGYTPSKKFIQTDFRTQLIHPQHQPIAHRLLQKHLIGETPVYSCELQMRHQQGHWIWILEKGKVIERDSEGNPTVMIGSVQNIAKEKNQKAISRSTSQHNRFLIEQAPTAIAMFDNNMCYLATSNQWLSDYGLEGQVIIGKSHYEIFPEIGEKWKTHHQRCLRGEVLECNEDCFERADGSLQWLKWKLRPWHTAQGMIGGMLMYTEDITEQKNKEKEQIRLKEILERTNEAAKIGAWELDLTTYHLTWSDYAKKICGVPFGFQPTRCDLYNFFEEGEHKENVKQALKRLLKRGKPFQVEALLLSRMGISRWVRMLGSADFEQGRCVRIFGTMQDIEKEKAKEMQLRISEDRFRGAFEHSANGMTLVNLEGRFFQVNKSLCKLVGYTEEELLRLTFQDITHPDDLSIDLQLLQELTEGVRDSYQLEKRYFHKSGRIVWILLSVSIVRSDSGEPIYYVAQINDITQEKQAKNKLQKSLSKLQGIQDASTQVSIIETNVKGIIKTFNRGAENLLGYHHKEVINKATPLLFYNIDEVIQQRNKIVKKTHKPISNFEALINEAKKGRAEVSQWSYKHKDGITLPALVTVTSIRNQHNRIVGYLFIASNITQLKKAQKEVQDLLDVTQQQNQRLLNFAHIVSHNLRSHSTNIAMLLSIMGDKEPCATQNDYFPLLEKAAESLQETMGHLNEVVAMNREVKENLRHLNLNQYIEKTLVDIQASLLEAECEIKNETNTDLSIQAVPAYLESILLNFLTNAVKYRSPERRLVISLQAEVEEEHLVLSIKDNGLGIDLKKYGAKLFGMYKTFHVHKDARGIGLFITKNQIEVMGGKIDVESEVDKGTTFKIYFRT